MKILSNKKYNDLISKQFRGIFADVNDDNLLRENGLLYGENKELKQEIERLNNIINELERELDRGYLDLFEHELVPGRELITNIKNYLQELKGGVGNETCNQEDNK